MDGRDVTERAEHDDWDAHWARYADVASLNPAQIMRHELVLDALRLDRIPIDRLLDVGSGQGDFLARAFQRGVANEYAGFELSDSGVAITRAKLPNADILQIDLFDPPPEAARFEGWALAAVCTDVIEHVEDPIEFLRAMRRYMAKGATLVLTVPGGPISAFDRHIGHRRHYSREFTHETLASAGFEVESVRLAGFPFFNAYRLLVILRGEKLIAEVESGEMARGESKLARLAMRSFHSLFRWNRSDSPFGWQVIARARAS